MSAPLRVAIIGMGGFAGRHHDAYRVLEEAGECKVIGACDPCIEQFGERQQELDFAGRGIKVYDHYLKMLDGCAGEIDLLTIPTPVPLHAEMHRAGVERGIPVYLEKPPTLDYAQMVGMLEVEKSAVKQTNIGFNFIIDTARQALKQRIVEGEFGKVRTVCFNGLWARNRTYYNRASWAGRLMMNGGLVLDSCLGNALAHFAHDVLHWGGTSDLWAWGEVESVEAELYRSHRIEGTDTVFVKAQLANGPEARIAMTHACEGPVYSLESVECEKATLYYLGSPTDPSRWEIVWKDGRHEQGSRDESDLTVRNMRTHLAYLRGERPRPVTRLADGAPFVMLNDLMYIAAGKITTVPESFITRTPETEEFASLERIAEVSDTFVKEGKLPSQQGIGWAVPGGKAVPSDIGRLNSVVAEMVENRAAELG